jgi:hypothetical protein
VTGLSRETLSQTSGPPRADCDLSQAGFKNLAATTITFDLWELKPNNPCLQGLVLETSSDSLQSVHALDAEFAKNRHLVISDSRQQATLVESAERSKAQLGKSNVPTPMAYGFLTLSEIAFDRTHRCALLNMSSRPSRSFTIVLEVVVDQFDSKWVHAKSFLVDLRFFLTLMWCLTYDVLLSNQVDYRARSPKRYMFAWAICPRTRNSSLWSV